MVNFEGEADLGGRTLSNNTTPQPGAVPPEPGIVMKGKISTELLSKFDQTTIASSIIDIDPNYFSSLYRRLIEFRLPVLNNISIKKLGIQFINAIMKRSHAEKLAELPFVKGITFDRPVYQQFEWDYPILNIIQDIRRSSKPINNLYVKPGMISTSVIKRKLGGYDAKSEGITGKDIKIAVCDTGFATNKQFRIGAVETHSTIISFGGGHDPSGHGTWCISAVGGLPLSIGKDYTIEGMCPDASMISIRCLYTPLGTGTTSLTLKALQMAYESEADIISMSLGGSQPTPKEDPYQKIIKAIINDGKIICISAGNRGPNSYTINGPGDVEEAITVGAWSYTDDNVSSFSSRGPTTDGRVKPDICSYGGGRKDDTLSPKETIISSSAGLLDIMDGGFRVASLQGTSMSTPLIAGLIGLWMQYYKKKTGGRLTSPMVKDIFKNHGNIKYHDTGWGLAEYSWIKEWLS